MKGDFTRFTFQPEKHYTGVYMQQGRLQLDSDWNEQVEIQKHLLRTYTGHLIDGSPGGGSGAPVGASGNSNFAIQLSRDKKDFLISKGHIYVNGILCELEDDTAYSNQPDHPKAIDIDLGSEGLKEGQKYIVYLDVWERNITALDDRDIAESALNGLDTTTRSKTVWQVRLIREAEWQNLLANTQKPEKQAVLTVTMKKQPVANCLYRVEIHQEGEAGKATFKWSRDNGSSVLPVKAIKEADHTLIVTGRDSTKLFAPGQWIEIIDESVEKNNQRGTFVQLTDVVSTSSDEGKLLFDPHTADADLNQFLSSPTENPTKLEERKIKVRRWNHDPNRTDKAIYSTTSNSSVVLEEGIEVRFNQEIQYRTGDYWLIPARVNQKISDWSEKLLEANGIRHHYLKLASLTFNGHMFDALQDERITFPSLRSCLRQGDKLQGLEKLSIGTSKDLATLEVQATKVKVSNGGRIWNDPEDSTRTIMFVQEFQPDEKLAEGEFIVAAGQVRRIVKIYPDQLLDAFTVDSELDLQGERVHFEVYTPIARFSSIDSGSNQTNVVITPQGRVGIGTETPAAVLTVQGKQDQTEIARFEDSTGTSQISMTAQGGIVANSLELRGPTSILKAGTFIGHRFELHDASDAIVAAIAIDHQQVQFKPAQPGASFAFAKFNDATPTRLVVQGGMEADSLKLDQGITITNFANSFDLAPGSNPAAVVPTISAVTARLDKKADLHGSLNTWFNTQNLTVNGVLAFQQGGVGVQHFSNHFTLLGGVDPQTSVPTVHAVQEYVGQRLANKPDREEVDRKLAVKANQAEVNAQLLGKANLHGDPDQDFVARDLKVYGAITLHDGEKVNEFSPEDLEISAAKPEDLVVPTAKAVKRYVDAQLGGKAEQSGDESLDFKAQTLTVKHAIAQETLTLKGVAIEQIAAALEADSADDQTLPTAKAVTDYAAPRGGSAKENYQAKNLTLAERLTVKGRGTMRALMVGANPQNDVLQDGEASFAGNIYYKGKLLQESSRALKRDIADLSSEEVSHLLRNLNPIKFSYNSDETQQVHIGFLSEEVPELLASVDQKAISISDIVGVLVQAVKEQRQATMALADVVDRQAAEIVQLKVQLKELEDKYRYRLG